MVYLFTHDIPKRVNATILGFAAGVMIAASVWSLLIPSIEAAEATYGIWSWIPAAIGFLLGGLFLVLLDHLLPHFHIGTGHEEGPHVRVHKSTRLFLAVTIHNIPEGLAIGVAFGSVYLGLDSVSLSSAALLSIGIGLQNLPEGAAISIPLAATGMLKKKAFFIGAISAIVEPISAVIGTILVLLVRNILPYMLLIAAAIMIYVVIDEIIPTSRKYHHKFTTIGFIVGFIIMMILDLSFN